MEQIIIQVRDKEKARVLFDLLTALDFVDSVHTSGIDDVEEKTTVQEETADFFALAGLWQDRKVTIESNRKSLKRRGGSNDPDGAD
jgi:hypothetical protein